MKNVFFNTKLKKVFTITASVIVMVSLLFALSGSAGNNNTYAATDDNSKYAIVIADQEVTYVDSEDSAKKVVSGLKKYYVSKGNTLMSVAINPAVMIKEVSTLNEDKSTKSAVTARTVSVAQAINTVRTSNLLTIKTVEKTKTTKSIDYKTVYKKSSKIRKTTTKVSSKGAKGKKQFVKKITKTNGLKTNSELISTSIVKKAKNKVVLKGTGSVRARRGKTISGTTGKDVVAYAKKFVGNPYVYGGTSLTRGCDCSGFVQSIYKHFGVNTPRVKQTSVGKRVSLKNIKPGDIVGYYNYGHMAIYIGNGKVVHAVNERIGIRITSINYTGRVAKVTRIFS